ncbi:hypothetical protein CPB86DRAFT_780025 [Serendipita vermifera]|nr:hypothetical protein CPB86DRAFT_780025 [Serendipita vermifera]
MARFITFPLSFFDLYPKEKPSFRKSQSLSTSNPLQAAGLLVLADLSTIAERTALAGTTSFWDALFLAPRIHRHQFVSEINRGELPATGAMTSGYVFRIENEATVSYLQRVGEPGHLVTVKVEQTATGNLVMKWLKRLLPSGGITGSICYFLGIALTFVVVRNLAAIQDLWAITVLVLLMVARLINVVLIRRRSKMGWKGAEEKGVKGDLLVLLSQDRWVRIQGLVDDLKAVTSGQWLRSQTTVEGFATAFATLLVYGSAALAANCSISGSLCIACLLVLSAGLLGLCNALTRTLQMFGRVVYVVGKPKKYTRRLYMAKELIKSSGRDDWAIGLGLIVPQADRVATVTL